MDLTLERFFSDGEATIGLLFLGGVFQCFVLEDEHRTTKVKGETRIPAGDYHIGLRNQGGMTKRYAQRYPKDHKGMLWLLDVPNFKWIYIHIGNKDDDTEGCLLVGDQCVSVPSEMRVLSSRPAYERLYAAVVKDAEAGS